MKADLNDLKKLTLELMKSGNTSQVQETNKSLIQKLYGSHEENEKSRNTNFALPFTENNHSNTRHESANVIDEDEDFLIAETIDDEGETLKLEEKEIQLIKKALEKNNGKRKAAADELGISERTLYRKIKQYDL